MRTLWFAELVEGVEKDPGFGEKDAFRPKLKMFLDLRNQLRLLQETPSWHVRVLAFGSRCLASSERNFIYDAFVVKEIGSMGMLVVPDFIYNRLKDTDAVHASRSVLAENDPELIETMIHLWDTNYESNFSSFRELLKTASSLR